MENPQKLEIKIALWNVWSLKDKDPEIVELKQWHKTSITGVLDSRRKGSGMTEVHVNFVLVWSGLEVKQRVMYSVGFPLMKTWQKSPSDRIYLREDHKDKS